MRQGLTAWGGIAALGLLAGLAPARAADLDAPAPYSGGPGSLSQEAPPPRYFPRAEENGDLQRRSPVLRRQAVRCRVWRVPVPTNAPDDPSYVGSAYGLGKPSYYGFTPPLGVDDPYGRPLLPYCP